MPKSLKIPKLFKKTAEELLWDIRNLSKHASTTEASLVNRYCIVIMLFTDQFIVKRNPKRASTTVTDLVNGYCLATMSLTDQFVADSDPKLDVFRSAKNDFYFGNKKFTLESLLCELESKKTGFLRNAQSGVELSVQMKIGSLKGSCFAHLKETIQAPELRGDKSQFLVITNLKT